MSARAPGPRAVRRAALTLAVALLRAAAAAAEPSATVQDGLRACAAIAADAERLACYDRLAGGSASAPAAAAAAPTPQPLTQAPPAAGAAAPVTPAAPAVATASSAPLPKESFGLYPAEHPKAPAVASSLETEVLAVGRSAGGHMTVTLEGGALWELDEDDPLLKEGDTVVISRASLGSFLMRTSANRTHRVRRLH